MKLDNSNNLSLYYHLFLSLHSFLTGLFLFFVPVYLHLKNFSLNEISFLIVLVALSYILCLKLFEHLLQKIQIKTLIYCSFCLYFFSLSVFFIENEPYFLYVLSITLGFYNCFFWTILRILFLQNTKSQNGKKYGNLQIIVMLALNSGILLGSFLLDKFDFIYLYFIASLICLLSIALFFSLPNSILPLVKFPFAKSSLANFPLAKKPITISSLIKYKDTYSSKRIFIVDGVFLFFESYFWVMSLSAINKHSFLELGFLVVFLSLFLGAVFVVLKSVIDKIYTARLFTLAVILYSLSWFLRYFVQVDLNLINLIIILSLITFATSVFRLNFNKIFFDVSVKEGITYIFLKSYFSQFSIALGYSFLALVFWLVSLKIDGLSYLYLIASAIALLYLGYAKQYIHQREL